MCIDQKLNYCVGFKVLRAADFGSPQNRERIYIVGFDRNYFGNNIKFDELFNWPIAPMTPTCVGDILEDISDLTGENDKFTISDKLWLGHKKRKMMHKQKGNGFGYTLVNKTSKYTNTLSARYYKDGSEILLDQSEYGKNPRKLTPRECARLQGFPENYIIDAVSKVQIYKQFGNSVCMNVINPIAESIVSTIKELKISTKQLTLELD